MRRIICIGNRYVREDAAGPRVHEALRRRELPRDVELIDGGLRGLDLLGLVDGAERVVFVDSVAGFGAPGEVVLLDGAAAAAGAVRFDHAAGLGYLLRVLPRACEVAVPEVVLVGVEEPAGLGAVETAADLAVAAAGPGGVA